MNVMYQMVAVIVVLGLLLAVFMTAYNIYIQFKEEKEFDIEYRKEQERKGK
jgi:Tfp pilus assembly protein PilE